MTTLLRHDWGFDGAVATDWGAVSQLVGGHHYATNEQEAIAAAINAGVDVVSDPRSDNHLPNDNPNPLTVAIVGAVNQRLLSEEVLTRAVARNLMVRLSGWECLIPDKVPFTPKHPFDPQN